jgi:hypothetical protein
MKELEKKSSISQRHTTRNKKLTTGEIQYLYYIYKKQANVKNKKHNPFKKPTSLLIMSKCRENLKLPVQSFSRCDE